MTLTLNLPPDATERLRHKAEQTGLSAEDAERGLVQAARQHTGGGLFLLGLVLMLVLFKASPAPEVEQVINDALRPFVDDLLKNGTEEQIAALLPKMPANPAPFYETATPEEWIAAFTEWTESHRDLPRVPASAFSREADYEDRF